jgi:predicted amidohydrolase
MALVSLETHLLGADSFPELAAGLGREVLKSGGEMGEILEAAPARLQMTRLELLIGATELDFWEEGVADPRYLNSNVELVQQLDRVAQSNPIELLGALRGLAMRALPEYFERQTGTLTLDYGMPVPLVDRPLVEVLESGTQTPSNDTLARGRPMAHSGCRVFEGHARGEVRFDLDFDHRARLDGLTWTADGRLPSIVTLHPAGSGSLAVKTIEEDQGWFFDAVPESCNVAGFLNLLAEAKSDLSAEIAVLPELCLETSDALGEALAANPESYPALVVAGSAHVRAAEDTHERRSNESRIYLDGDEIGMARKCHPYATKKIGDEEFDVALEEGITGQKKVTIFSGRHTRFAVAICSDLNDDLIPHRLVAAGVNLLLVPSNSTSFGGFEGAIGMISSQCQGVAAIANPPLSSERAPVFLLGVAVPHVDGQVGQFPAKAGEPLPQIAKIDPNRPLASAVEFHRGDTEFSQSGLDADGATG